MHNFHSTHTPGLVAAALLLFYGIAEGHVCDIHPRLPSEILHEQEIEREKENQKAEQTLNNNNSSEFDRMEANETLVRNGKRA